MNLMSKHLYHISNSLKNYLSYRRLIFKGDNAQVLFLKGEARFRLAFFEVLNTQKISDSHSQYQLWQRLIEDKQAIVELAEKSGLAVYAKLNSHKTDYPQQCWFCYCVVFAQAETVLVQALSEGFVLHYLPIFFPKIKPLSELVVLQKQLNRLLQKKYSQRVLLKESFQTNADGVSFSLLLKLANQKPEVLLTQTGKRLKSTRLAVYKQVVKLME